jgi:hypothetical protein
MARTGADPKRPGGHHRRLEVFLGTWEATGEIEIEGATTRIRTHSTYEWLPGGYFLVHRFESHLAGGKVIEGIEILGFDDEGQRYTAHAFDSLGIATAYEVTVEGNSGDKMTISRERPDGEPLANLEGKRVR